MMRALQELRMPEPGEPVQGLIEQLQTGASRDEAFRRLFDLYSPRLYHFFTRRGFPHQECLDLTQETFLGIYRGMEGYRRDASFETWLFKIATNTYRKRLRWGAAGKRGGQEAPWRTRTTAGRWSGSRRRTLPLPVRRCCARSARASCARRSTGYRSRCGSAW